MRLEMASSSVCTHTHNTQTHTHTHQHFNLTHSVLNTFNFLGLNLVILSTQNLITANIENNHDVLKLIYSCSIIAKFLI